MGKPAARITDMHVCPMVTPAVPPIPHVGGPIIGPGVPNVLIGGMPAAVMGDMCVCVGPPDVIVLGSVGVMIGGKPAARMGDTCAHGGAIVAGCPTVLIGEISPAVVAPEAPSNNMADAMGLNPDDVITPQNGVVINELAMGATKLSAAFATQVSRISALIKGAENGEETVHKHNEEECKVQYKVVDKENNPAKDVNYEIRTNDGQQFSGKTDQSGMTKQISGYTEGMCSISFPDL